ncbi:hypothetical protein FO519_001390 [Halicephalobus sp. NKZ332]|nr:hypothetical protein FO519_001390 [Halicephalobus sp. NKZ332]
MGEPIRETPGTVAIYPTTERKGRAKQVQLVLRPSSLEIHKSAKDVKNNKEPKYNIELADLFNICLDNEPNQIKNECISLMTTETTFYLLPVDPESSLNDWFELLMDRIREARSRKLLRPVFREEFFEAAWDVNIIKRPKLRKDYPKIEKVEDLADKLADIQGRRRLCISPTCFLLFKMKVSPTADGDQPFEKESYTELPLNVISNYGKQEKYFFLRVGRCSEIGSGELWMATESGNSATQLHEKLSKINQRDADNRRQQGVMLSLGGISSRVLKSRQLRERAQQNRNRDNVGAEVRSRTNTMTEPSDISKDLSPTPETTISIPTPPLSSPQLAPIDRVKEESKASTPKKSSFADMASKIQSKFHYGSFSNSSGGTFTKNPEYSDNPALNSMEAVSAFVQPSKNDQPPRTLSPRHYKNIAEDYMSYDPPVDSRKASAAYSVPIRQVSVMSATDSVTLPQDQGQSHAEDNSDYIRMKSRTGPMTTDGFRFPIKEARSYVSDHDSTESCYSSAIKRARRDSNSEFGDDQSHGQRAFSLGSKPPLKNLPLSHHKEDFDEVKIEDIRKRAHSAGSKTWGFAVQRKVSEGGDMRVRTGSMGAQGRRRERDRNRVSETEDHVEMEFSDGSKQGSLASIDSPSVRSRNSSFGVQGATSMRSAVDSAISRLRILATAEELAAVKVEETQPRSSSARDSHPNAYPTNRRSSAPENTPVTHNESDYVQITCPKKKRTIETITESAFSSSSELSSPESTDSEISEKKTKKRSSIQGPTPAAGLEYAVIHPSTVPDVDSSMIQPVMSFFGGPGGSSTPPLTNASPQYPPPSSSCEYTVIHAPNKN